MATERQGDGKHKGPYIQNRPGRHHVSVRRKSRRSTSRFQAQRLRGTKWSRWQRSRG